jgi:hypothetical protein
MNAAIRAAALATLETPAFVAKSGLKHAHKGVLPRPVRSL